MSSSRIDDPSNSGIVYVQIPPSDIALHLLTQMQRASCMGWLGIEADLRLPPLIRLFLTLEPVDCPPDEYGYSAGV